MVGGIPPSSDPYDPGAISKTPMLGSETPINQALIDAYKAADKDPDHWQDAMNTLCDFYYSQPNMGPVAGYISDNSGDAKTFKEALTECANDWGIVGWPPKET